MISDGNNFNNFLQNRFTIDFAFLCKPAWGTPQYHRFPLCRYHLGERRSPKIYLEERRSIALPLDYTTGTMFTISITV